jgi:hypothetical protein
VQMDVKVVSTPRRGAASTTPLRGSDRRTIRRGAPCSGQPEVETPRSTIDELPSSQFLTGKKGRHLLAELGPLPVAAKPLISYIYGAGVP